MFPQAPKVRRRPLRGWRLGRRAGERGISRNQGGERRKRPQEVGGGDWVGPEVLHGQISGSGVAIEEVLDGVAAHAALRTKRGSRAAHFSQVVVQQMTVTGAELSERAAIDAGKQALRRRQRRSRGVQDATTPKAIDDVSDSAGVKGFEVVVVFVHVSHAAGEKVGDAVVELRGDGGFH